MSRHADVIRSRTNPALKRVGAVRAGKERGLVLLEGDRLVDDAIGAGHGLELLLVREDRGERAERLAPHAREVRLVEGELLDRVSSLDTSPGILALCVAPAIRPIAELEPGPRSLYLVASGVANPGNLGALARSAEAAGVEALVLTGDGVDPWNEKALRGSMGSLLRLPAFGEAGPEEAAAALVKLGVRQVVAATRSGKPLRGFDFAGPIALWVGAETGELPVAAEGFERVTIPMAGSVESLNVAVAAALILFAAGRTEGEG